MFILLQKADSSTKANADASKPATNELDFSETNPSSTDERSLRNTVPQVPKNSEEHLAASVNQQHNTPPANTDEQHSALQGNIISIVKLRTHTITDNDHHSKAPESSEGSDTNMANTPAVSVPGNTATDDVKVDQMPRRGTEEIARDPAKLSAPPETKQEDQGAQYDENIENQNIVNYKNHFQKYLIKKGLNHQPMGGHKETNDLQRCLSSYTDLDVLDEDNKFICKTCTAKKQCMLIQ